MGEDQKQLLHVGVLAFPYGTHAIPLLTLIRKLAISSPSTNFSYFSTTKSNLGIFGGSKSFFNSIFKSKSSLFGDLPNNVKVYNIEDGIPIGFNGHPMAEMEIFIKSMVKNYRKGIDSVLMGSDNKKFSCIITDAFLWFASEIADEMGVPWISLWTAGACSLSTHFYTDLIRESIPLGQNGITERGEEIITFIPGMSVLRINDLQEGVLFGGLETDFSLMLLQMGRMMSRATAVLINSFDELDLPVLEDLRSKFQNCLTLGPFTLTSPSLSHIDDIHGCISWLDTKKPTSVVYISFGTVTTPPPNELEALAEGLEESGVPFLWSIKDNMRVHFPNGFLERTKERGLVVSWAPQERILGHASLGVFVTHCGWNSVLESITAGVPMMCRPFFGDQRINSRLVSDIWGIGIKIQDGVFTKDGMINGLDLILKVEGKRMREKVGSLRGLAKHAVSPYGSSSKNFESLLEIVCGK